MLRALVIAATIALVAPGLAVAQDHHDDHHQGGPPHPGGPPPHPVPPRPGFAPHGPPPGAMAHPMGHPVGGPPGAVAQFSYRGRMIERVHIHPFIYPPGFAYRRWAVGAALPPVFLARDYWYADWATLGVEPPPPGYQWVRYGPDLILVNVITGQVADVAYGVFYD
jgi:Nickel/cobalt transporter regulator